MPEAEKIAISLNRKLLQKIEKVRKATGETRSAFIARALEQLFRQHQKMARVSEYVEGYGRQPENTDEIAAAEAAAIAALSQENWE